MISAVFEADNGKKFLLGVDNGIVFSADVGNGVSVNLGKSQGFGQIGETVQTQSVGGKPINIKGVIFSDIAAKKAEMRNAFAPFVSGRLVFDGKYYTRVYVKDPPSFSATKNDGRFMMQLYAPYPYFYSINERTFLIGAVKPLFKFPINYSTPHKFGEKSGAKYVNVQNNGDVPVPYRMTLSTSLQSTNPTITDMQTLSFIRILGVINVGDTVTVYRDDDGVLRAELENENGTQDIIYRIDEASTLFDIRAGENLILAEDDEGGNALTARFVFSEAVAAYYEY